MLGCYYTERKRRRERELQERTFKLTRKSVILFTSLSLLALSTVNAQVIQAQTGKYNQSKSLAEIRLELGFEEAQDEETQDKEAQDEETQDEETQSQAQPRRVTDEESVYITLTGEGVEPSLVTLRKGAPIFETIGLDATSVWLDESKELATNTRIMDGEGYVYYRVYNREGYKVGYVLERDILTQVPLTEDQGVEVTLAIEAVRTGLGIESKPTSESNESNKPIETEEIDESKESEDESKESSEQESSEQESSEPESSEQESSEQESSEQESSEPESSEQESSEQESSEQESSEQESSEQESSEPESSEQESSEPESIEPESSEPESSEPESSESGSEEPESEEPINLVTNYEESDYYYIRLMTRAQLFSDELLTELVEGVDVTSIYQVRGEFITDEGIKYLSVYEGDDLLGYVIETDTVESESPEYYEVVLNDLKEESQQYVRLKDDAVIYRDTHLKDEQDDTTLLDTPAYKVKQNLTTRGVSYHGIFNGDDLVGYVDSRQVERTNPYGETHDEEMGRSYNSHEEFLEMLVDYSGYAKDNNIFPSVMIAQALHESYPDGHSGLAKNNKNMFGIKGQYKGQSSVWSTGEHTTSGSQYTIDASFRAYPSYLEGVQDYVNLLNIDYYTDFGVNQAKTPEEQIKAIHKAGYATDVSYAEKVITVINKYNLKQYDK